MTTTTFTATLWGGHSYAHGDAETFPSLAAAAAAYVDRYDSNGIRKVDGVYWPAWGECADDAYVITTEDGDGWTRAEVFALADAADVCVCEIPFTGGCPACADL